MHTTHLEDFKHDHTFGQDKATKGERRTLIVAMLTAVFMVVEVWAGVVYGSMALLADGLHMGSHALALGIAVLAYVYARKNAKSDRFSFGTGKVNALGGFSGALLLALFAVFMAVESFERFLSPVAISFDQAIAVAVVGLLVNGISVALLGVHSHDHDHGHSGHDHGHSGHDHAHSGHDHAHSGHDHAQGAQEHAAHDHGHSKHDSDQGDSRDSEDQNLRSAYFHVLADALTSFTAIFALVAGKYFDQVWLDPAMGIVGSLLVARWSVSLLRDTSKVLLDHQAGSEVREAIKAAIERDSEDRVVDLHVWTIGVGVRAAIITIVSHEPRSPDDYKQLLPTEFRLRHVTVEVHLCPNAAAEAA